MPKTNKHCRAARIRPIQRPLSKVIVGNHKEGRNGWLPPPKLNLPFTILSIALHAHGRYWQWRKAIAFTEVQLADGNWADVLTLAAKASAPLNVIVVAPFVDAGFYVQAIERGTFDFIASPLSDPEFLHVVRIAAENAIIRRRKHAATLPPSPLALHSPA